MRLRGDRPNYHETATHCSAASVSAADRRRAAADADSALTSVRAEVVAMPLHPV